MVVTAIALPADDPSFAGALPGHRVARPRLGADREALAGVARVLALGPVVVFLQRTEDRKPQQGISPPTYQSIKAKCAFTQGKQ